MTQQKITAYIEVDPANGDDLSPLFVIQELRLEDLRRIEKVYDLVADRELTSAKFAGGGLPKTADAEGHNLWVKDIRVEDNGDFILEIDQNHGDAEYETTALSIGTLRNAFDEHPVVFLGFDPCRSTEAEARAHYEQYIGFDRDEFHDFVVSHGFGSPTEEAYQWAAHKYAQDQDYAGIAADVVTQGWIVETDAPGVAF
ncbi:hypothetical protein [Geopseudomonas aromaticivorans]